MAEQPSEEPTFKLTYFNLKGSAEPIRLLFIYGGIEYEDERIEHDDWPGLKPCMWTLSFVLYFLRDFSYVFWCANLFTVLQNLATPFGQLPLLEVDGIRVHQSCAIMRYVAKRVGLAGSNDWESLLIDVVCDTVNDLKQSESVILFES